MQILVMTKTAGINLQADIAKRGQVSHFFHSSLDAGEKEKIHGLMGKALIIATTGWWLETVFGLDLFTCDV